MLFITGDLNIHLERPDDPNNVTLRSILSSLGLGLRVDGSTHDLGVVLQKENCHQCIVEREDTGLSDHWLLLWNTTFPRSCPPVTSCHVHGWRCLGMTQLIQQLGLSSVAIQGLSLISTKWWLSTIQPLWMWSTHFFQISHLTLIGTSNHWFDVECRREKQHLKGSEELWRVKNSRLQLFHI